MKSAPSRIIATALISILLPCFVLAGPDKPDRRQQAVYADFTNGLEQFGGGRFEQSIYSFDRLIAGLSPADSQLAFLGLYYGMRARLALGRRAAADSLYVALRTRIPQAQTAELLAVLGHTESRTDMAVDDNIPGSCRKIGVILPLSGRYADFGKAIQEGIQIAVDRYNSGHGEGSRIELLFRDDQSDPVIAATAGRELAKDSLVAALIGSHQDEATLSLAMAASSLGLPLVCPTADSPSLIGLGPLVHAINRADPAELLRLTSFAVRDLGLQIFAILAPETERGAMLAAGFRDAVHKSGGSVVANLRYSGDNNKFDSQMTFLQRYLPDAIFIPADLNDITQIASQIHYYGLEQSRIIGTEAWRSERVLRMGGEYVEGVIIASPFYEGARELSWESFKSEYEQKYNRPVNRFSALGYDSAEMILEAAGAFPVSRKGLAKALTSVSGMRGAYGQYSVAADGRVERKTYILEIRRGEIVPAQVPPAADSGATVPDSSGIRKADPGAGDAR